MIYSLTMQILRCAQDDKLNVACHPEPEGRRICGLGIFYKR